MKKIFVIIGILAICSMAQTMTDPRDGKTYKTVKIGDQVWMAENLNYEVEGSKCYKSNPANCEEYGRLYTLEVAKNACPVGWHLPSKDEFAILLKKVGSDNRNLGNFKGTDEFGFTALPAGYFCNFDTKYGRYREMRGIGDFALFWSSSGYYECITSYGCAVCNDITKMGAPGLSVRCLQDSN